jgi:hypothetical protein
MYSTGESETSISVITIILRLAALFSRRFLPFNISAETSQSLHKAQNWMSSLAGFCVLVPSLGHFNFPVLNKI